MPYVQRDSSGAIRSLHREAQPDAFEYLDAAHPQVQAFLGGELGVGLGTAPRSTGKASDFARLDGDFVRVLEDLIDLLVAKHSVIFTELPPHAQAKLLARKNFRENAAGGTHTPGPFDDTGFADIIDDTDFGKL